MPLIAGFGMLIHTKSRRTPLCNKVAQARAKESLLLVCRAQPILCKVNEYRANGQGKMQKNC